MKADPMINPLDLTPDQLEKVVGRILSVDEMQACRAVLNYVRRALHGSEINNGNHHHTYCWAGGPPHYMCAYNKVNELIKVFGGRQGDQYDTSDPSDSSEARD